MAKVTTKKRIIIGVSGASGIPLAQTCLALLREQTDYQIELIMSQSAKVTAQTELGIDLASFYAYADVVHDETNIGASVASGTYESEGMLIIPCSMKTLAGIRCGYSDNLLLRAADVTIKEGRKLVLATRETPLSPIHLDNMLYLSKLPQVQIVPPVISYYHKPKTLADVEFHIACKLLACFGIKISGYQRWE
ncbi:MAG: UbiX family flavin prenyltransferase [Culicoidibacterales bacterium]